MAAQPLRWVLALACVLAPSAGLDLTPVQKVIEMLSELKAEVEADGAAEEISYTNFSNFCKDTEDAKLDAIATGQATVDETNASLVEVQSQHETKLAEVQERKTKNEELEAEKAASKKDCSEKKLAFDKNDAELGSAIIALESAIGKLDAAKDADVALLQMGSSVEQSLRLADALGMMTAPRRAAAAALLQEEPAWLKEEGAEYNKEEYGFQSGGIVATLQDLKKEFSDERSTAQSEWTSTSDACAATEAEKTDAIQTNSDALDTAKQDASKLAEDIAAFKETLLTTGRSLQEDRTYLSQLQENCAAKAAEWKQRSEKRAGEIQALVDAQSTLEKEVKVNLASVAQTVDVAEHKVEAAEPPRAPASFLQQNLLRRASRSGQRAKLAASLQAQASSRLASEAGRLASSRLKGLSQRLAKETPEDVATDPLAAVKKMVEDLVTKLLKEAESEASEKGFCDTEMKKAEHERNRRIRKVNKLSAHLNAFETKRVMLIEEVDELSGSLTKLQADYREATELRANETASNEATIAMAKSSTEGVNKALDIIKDFYKKAAKEVFLARGSEGQKPPDTGFDGKYGGKQDASLGIVAMLEVARDDFIRTAQDTEAEEKEAAEKFYKLEEDAKADISGKSVAKTMAEEDLASVVQNMKQGKLDLQGDMDLLDGALWTLEDLKPRCVDNKESYEERQAKREEEINALKTALCTLDADNVEPMCQ
eukprot:gb/GFBE01055702.1/.p1 GENE.gb/GFBE01055702.1/~~gb/GFBE01055702.1/.p1  ORF type:complete len:713 (+),score=265.19 gb/GFBE01055702.1/:1-2139(+)